MTTIKDKIREYRWKFEGRDLPMGLGGAYLGHLAKSEAQLTEKLKFLDECYALGIRYFDTSCDYGTSETLLGRWLAGIPRDSYFLSTKGRYPYERPDALEQLKRDFYTSFERLKVDRIDLYMIHDADAYGVLEEEVLPFLLERKKEGMIDYIGQGTRDETAHRHAIEDGVMDGLLAYRDFSLVHGSGRKVAALAGRQGKAYLNGSPLVTGLFIAPHAPRSCQRFHRSWEDARFAGRMRALLDEEKIDHVAAALQYPMLFPEVDMTLTGTSNVDELRSTVDALRATIHPEQWAKIFRLQEQYRYFELQPEFDKFRGGLA